MTIEVMDTTRFGPDDADPVAAYAELVSAARALDAPWRPPTTPAKAAGRFRHGWDGEVELPFLGLADGAPVAVGVFATSEYDNRHLSWLEVVVHPEHRRRGHGSAMLDHLIAETRAAGRTTAGIDGWETDAACGFAARHGFEQKSVAVERQQRLADVDWAELERLHADARTRAAAYDVVRRAGRTPDDELEQLGALTEAINDAPTDDLDVEDEVYPPERVRGYEEAQLGKGYRLHRVLARHRETGALAGHTVVLVDGESPERGHQHDTAVASAHRGHRLGLLLKTEMNLWLREAEPQLRVVSTFNADSNDHMIGVNEAIGYRAVGRELEFQRAV